jgi:hypothetical protein
MSDGWDIIFHDFVSKVPFRVNSPIKITYGGDYLITGLGITLAIYHDIDDITEIFIYEYECKKSMYYTDKLKSYLIKHTANNIYTIKVAMNGIRYNHTEIKKTHDELYETIRNDRIMKQYLKDNKNATIFPAVIEDIITGYL